MQAGQLAEILFLKAVSGYKIADHKRNEDIGVLLGIPVIKIYPNKCLELSERTPEYRIPMLYIIIH
jgi:hypothetical protein